MLKVAQCWDDGVATDIRLVSIFRKYGVKATFNLCPGLIPDKTEMPYWKTQPYYDAPHLGFMPGRVGKDRLKEVYDGFCVASHCWCHEHAQKVPTEQFVKSAVDARHFLEDFFQKPCPGFAWPCGASTEETMNALRNAGFLYGRSCENVNNVSAELKDPLWLPSNCHFQDSHFWPKFAAAKKEHHEFFYFWGHSYQMLDCDGLWDQLEEKIAILSRDPEVCWVDVAEIASAVPARRQAALRDQA